MATVSGKARLRLAVIGAGKHGARYAAHAARDVEGIELVAVCRRDRTRGEALAADLGCGWSDDALALLGRRDIDAVVFATVPALLPGFVEAAIASGKRMVVEKPVAPSLDAGLAMLAAVEASGLYCMAGHTLRFNAAIEALARELPTLGRLDSLLFSQRFPPQPGVVWLDEPALSGGGNVLHTGTHCFDLLAWLSGERVSTAFARTARVVTRNTEDNFTATLTTGRPGLLAQVACSRSTDSRNGLVEASGEHGQVVVDHVLGTGYRLGPGGRRELAVDSPRMTVRFVLERLVADARRDSPPPITFREGLAAVAVAEACYRSAASGREEAVLALP